MIIAVVDTVNQRVGLERRHEQYDGRTVRGTNDANDWSSSSSSWRRRPRPTTVDTKTRQNTPAVYLHHLFRSVSIIGTTLLISGTADRPVPTGARYFPRARITVRDVTRTACALRSMNCYPGQMLATGKYVYQKCSTAAVVGFTNINTYIVCDWNKLIVNHFTFRSRDHGLYEI